MCDSWCPVKPRCQDILKPWYLYIVRCASGALYTGIALNPWDRIKKHNEGRGAKAVKALGLPVKLEHLVEIGDKSRALSVEAWVKSLSKKKKEELLLLCKKSGCGLIG